MKQVSMNESAAAYVEALRKECDFQIAVLTDIGETVGEVLTCARNWKDDIIKPDFLKILDCLEKYRLIVHDLTDTVSE